MNSGTSFYGGLGLGGFSTGGEGPGKEGVGLERGAGGVGGG